jgi:superfamily II DNA or RNA helicase
MFFKHQLAWFTPHELEAYALKDHLKKCFLYEKVFQRPPRRHNFAIKHGKNFYCFPKQYALSEMLNNGIPVEVRVTDGARFPIDLEFNGKLDPDLKQDVAVRETLQKMENSVVGGAVLSLPCGHGKTVCGLAIAHILSRKCFILVHTKFLAKQWEERIKFFLPGASVYHFNSKSKQGDDREAQFSIGLMQTIVNLDSYNYGSQYGLLIIDECHHVPCLSLRNSLPRFNSRYTLGLSATPHRADNLDKYIYWALGEQSFLIKPSYENVSVLKVDHFEPFRPHFHSFEDRLASSETRNFKIVSIVKKLADIQKRKILVLTMRREHAKHLFQLIGPSKAELCLGGQENDFNTKKSVILSTYQLCSEGLDVKGLNSLLLALPKSDLVQVIGRITRGGKSSDDPPIVIDIVDQDDEAQRKYARRRSLYKSLNMVIKNSQL